MLIELNEDTLQDVVASTNKVVVQYSASWCGNCRIMKPKFKKLASENEEITFVLVDAENAPESRKWLMFLIYQPLQLLLEENY